MSVRLLIGDCRERLRELEAESVHCCVTSPPYFGLRDYGCEGQIGLEATPEAFVAEMVGVFEGVRRVLKPAGTLWLNLGDSYCSSPPGNTTRGVSGKSTLHGIMSDRYRETLAGGHATKRDTSKIAGLKPKDLIGIPWRVAFALQAAGWYLRQDIIWAKPNPMPESVTDRCTKAHEYLFLLSKSAKYHFDAEAISEAVSESSLARWAQDIEAQKGSDRVPGKTNGRMKAVGRKNVSPGALMAAEPTKGESTFGFGETRNRRSVWTVATQPFKEAHFATYPPELIEPCILAGCPKGGTVLDPFGGAGTTGMVADRLGRNAVLIELNPAYAALAEKRLTNDAGLFAEISTEADAA